MKSSKKYNRIYVIINGEKRTFVPFNGENGGYILYTPSDIKTGSSADYEADKNGNINFQGKKVGKKLTAKQLAKVN